MSLKIPTRDYDDLKYPYWITLTQLIVVALWQRIDL